MSEPEIRIGGTYRLEHCRFGRAKVTVKAIDGEWLDVAVIAGALRGMGVGAFWGPGDTKRVRHGHCTFTEQEAGR